jgi:repressor LexA
MMPKPLLDLERRVLDFLVEYLRSNTYQPSIREIGRRFDIKSTKTVSELLQSLAEKGWIERDPSRSRGVRLLGLGMHPETVTVPWYERASEGSARGDRVVDEFELDRKLAGSAGTFIITMSGESLADEGIRHGDLLLVEPVPAAMLEHGDIVVVRTGDGPAVKRLYRRSGEVLLEPSDADYAPQRVPSLAALEVAGRVVSIVRRLRLPPKPRPAGAHAATAAHETV